MVYMERKSNSNPSNYKKRFVEGKAMSIEAMKQTLELLKKLDRDLIIETWELAKTMGDLEQAIATEESSAVQEPVAWMVGDNQWVYFELNRAKAEARVHGGEIKPLYQHAQPKAEQEPVGDFENASFDELLEHYWQIAYAEGQTGESYGDKANEVLFRLRSIYTHPQPKAEQDELHKAIGILQGLLTEALKVLDSSAINNIGPLKDKMRAAALPWDRRQKAEPKREPLKDEPNLFWNDDDPEMPYDSIDEFLNEEWCNGGLEVGEIRTVQRAIRLPNVTVRVTAVSEDGEIDYAIEAAHGIKE